MVRNISVDIAKGIGILFVILGHSWFASNKEIATVIFSFHMPLFFFLSGLFFNVNDNFKKLSLKKISSLIKPYLTTLVIVGIIYITVKKYPLSDYVLDVLYASSGTIPWGPLSIPLIILEIVKRNRLLSILYLSDKIKEKRD